MIGLLLGTFLLIVCVIMLIWGSGDIGGFFGVIFVMVLALALIFKELKKRFNDGKTSLSGEKCYARIMDCIKTGNFFGSKEEYKIIAAVYVPSLQKRIILEETVGFNNYEKYPTNSYFMVLFYDNDINVKEKVDEIEIPNDILKILKDESVLNDYVEYNKGIEAVNKENQFQTEGQLKKASEAMEKAQLIIKRVLLGIPIGILLIIVLIDTAIVKQTIISKDYIETTATYFETRKESFDSPFSDGIYIFYDKQGEKYEVVKTITNDYEEKQVIKVKYNENNPEDYYVEGQTFDELDIKWYILKVFVLILLIVLFFNKKLLSKIKIVAR